MVGFPGQRCHSAEQSDGNGEIFVLELKRSFLELVGAADQGRGSGRVSSNVNDGVVGKVLQSGWFAVGPIRSQRRRNGADGALQSCFPLQADKESSNDAGALGILVWTNACTSNLNAVGLGWQLWRFEAKSMELGLCLFDRVEFQLGAIEQQEAEAQSWLFPGFFVTQRNDAECEILFGSKWIQGRSCWNCSHGNILERSNRGAEFEPKER